MKNLSLNQMEAVEGGRSKRLKCEWGIALAGAFVGGAFALATAGLGSFFVGIGFAAGIERILMIIRTYTVQILTKNESSGNHLKSIAIDQESIISHFRGII